MGRRWHGRAERSGNDINYQLKERFLRKSEHTAKAGDNECIMTRTNNRGSLPPGLSNLGVRTEEMSCWIYTKFYYLSGHEWVGILGSLYGVRGVSLTFLKSHLASMQPTN